MADARKIKRTVKREGSPFQYLRSCSFYAFEESKKREEFANENSEGWLSFKTSGFVFLAFWVESYLNFALEETFSAKQYKVFERLPVKEKIDLLAERFSILLEKDTVGDLFSFRDDLAHGKSFKFEEISDLVDLESYKRNFPSEYRGLQDKQKTTWEIFLQSDPKKISDKLETLLSEIYKVAKLKWHPMGVGDLRVFGAEVIG